MDGKFCQGYALSVDRLYIMSPIAIPKTWLRYSAKFLVEAGFSYYNITLPIRKTLMILYFVWPQFEDNNRKPILHIQACFGL